MYARIKNGICLNSYFSTICSTNQPVLDDPDNYQSDLDEYINSKFQFELTTSESTTEDLSKVKLSYNNGSD